MRFTKKSVKFVNAYKWNRETLTKTFVQLGINKLGQLEDNEEQLGIDLSILPRLLEIKPKDIIYVKQRGVVVECEVTDNALIDGTLIVFSHYYIGHTVYTPVCHYNKYGKTWASSKEELLKK